MKELVVVLVMVATFAASAAAQTPGAPPRDRPAQPATGTGGIRGRVIAADTGEPLRRALVRLASWESGVFRTVGTDAEGRFNVTDLPAGSYGLTVTRNGYASLQFGQQRPFEGGRVLELANGQLMDRVDFALPRGSVITGRVTDQLGEPVAGIRMQAMRFHYLPGGDRQLMGASVGRPFTMVTNDLGEFRVSGLLPGTYVLSANLNDSGMSGIVRDSAARAQASGESYTYATTFYPGTISAEQAEPITLGAGDVASASFVLSTARLTRVSGMIRDSQGRPGAGGRLSLQSRTPTSAWGVTGPQIGADGRFSIANLPPGDYSIEVAPMSGGLRPTADTAFDEVASVRFTAAGQDITDLIITTAPGATISGRVIFEGTSKAARPDHVSANSPDHRTNVVYRRSDDNGAIDAAGRFQLRGIIGRAIFVTGFKNPAARLEWSVKSVMLNGADITDTPLDIPIVGEISGIEITLSDTPSRLSGIVTNARREPVKDYAVVILPERLREGVLPGRFTRTARPNQEGRYEIRDLPAGDYLAVAVSGFEFGHEWDPAFRTQVEPAATRFRLGHGQTAVLDLQLIP